MTSRDRLVFLCSLVSTLVVRQSKFAGLKNQVPTLKSSCGQVLVQQGKSKKAKGESALREGFPTQAQSLPGGVLPLEKSFATAFSEGVLVPLLLSKLRVASRREEYPKGKTKKSLHIRILSVNSLVGYFCCAALGLLSPLWGWKNANADVPGCPTPALSRFQRHQVARGETLDSIAQRYNLTPATIIRINPGLGKGSIPLGSEILIPPFNGIVVEVPRGQTWRQVAAKYKVRADALFEVNGCQKDPSVVFVPGAGLSSNRPALQPSTPVTTTSNITTPATSGQLGGYPLPQAAQVALAYGWQINPANGEVFFHSGVDLLTAKGTPVSAIAPGKIVFAGEQGSYGNLVIINHNGGFQTRYAHLDRIKVSVGQSVNKGDEIGTVGTTGQPTTNQPHLHFEVRSSSDLGWVAKDPKDYLKR